MSELLTNISQAVIDGNADTVIRLTNEALKEGLSAQNILDQGLISGMDYVGTEFKNGNAYVPEVLLSARVMHASLDILKPILAESGGKMAGKVIIGTVKGDLHDLGKNLVGMMLEGAGFEVIDLGTDVAPDVFVNTIREKEADVLGMSALLTTTMPAMADTIKAIKEADIRDQIKIMIGGAPVTKDFADSIGADALGSSAPEAVDLAKKFVNA